MSNLLEVKNLSYIYGKNTPYEKIALQDINFTLEEGKILGIVGHSGCGKSTLSKLLNGLLKATNGDIILEGINIWEKPKNIKSIRFKVGLVFQYPEHQLFADTVKKDIEFGVMNMGFEKNQINIRVRKVCDILNIPLSILDKSPFSLSGGEQKKVALAGVMCMQPKILILDEPTSSLDPLSRNNLLNQVMAYKEEFNASVIFISHNMQELSLICDNILVIKEGKQLAIDTPQNLFFDDKLLNESGLKAPEIIYIAKELKKLGYRIKDDILTVDDMCKNILELLGGDNK